MSAEELKAQGNEAFKGRNFDKAIELYTQAIALDDSSNNAALCFSNRAAAYQSKKDWVKMENDAEKCVQLKPGFAKGWHRLAVAQKKQGMLVEARQTLEKGLELHADDKVLKKAMRQLETMITKRTKHQQMGAQLQAAVSKELGQLQQDMEHLRTQMAQVDGQERSALKSRRINQITAAEVGKLADDTPTYRAVGKMFLYSSKAETETFLQAETEELEKKTAALASQKKYLEKKGNDLTKNMKELMEGLRQ